MLQGAFPLLEDTVLEGKIPVVAVLLVPCLVSAGMYILGQLILELIWMSRNLGTNWEGWKKQ